MEILVTGGTGFVGRYIVGELSKNFQVIIPTRDIKRGESIFTQSDYFKNIKIIHFQEDLDHIVKKYRPQIIINLLGILYERKKEDITFEKVHFEYTKKLVDAASDIDTKLFVQMSALGADPRSKSRYQRTKGVAEEYIRSSNINYIIHRPSIIMGKEQKLFEDMKKFGRLMPIFFAPEGKVQPVHILDVRDSFLRSLNEKNEIYELCGDRIVTFKELFEFALDYVGYKRPIIQMPKIFFKFMLPFFSLLPEPPMTKDQYYMLQKDNICSGKYRGVKELLGKIRNPFEF